jgi:hypothetical protein
MLFGKALHGCEQFWHTFLDGCWAGRLNRANSKPGVIHHELFEVGGKQVFNRTLTQVGGSGSEKLLSELLDLFSGNLRQFGCDTLVACRAGGRTQDQPGTLWACWYAHRRYDGDQ